MSTNIFTRLGIPEPVTAEGIAAFVIDSGDHCESWGSQFCTDHGCLECYALVIEAYANLRVSEAIAATQCINSEHEIFKAAMDAGKDDIL